jgi:hypothetical protein
MSTAHPSSLDIEANAVSFFIGVLVLKALGHCLLGGRRRCRVLISVSLCFAGLGTWLNGTKIPNLSIPS